MAKNENPKPVDLMAIGAFKHDGEHIAAGTVLFAVESDLALELTGAGRTRLATEEEVAKARKKADKTAAPAA